MDSLIKRTAENALKQVYLPIMRNQLNIVDHFISKVEKTTKDVYGKEIIVIHSIIEADGKNEYIQFKQDLANMYCTLTFSEKAIRTSTNNINAFVNLVNDEISSSLEKSKNQIMNAIYGQDFTPLYMPKGYKYEPLILNGLETLFDFKAKTYCKVDRERFNLNPKLFVFKDFDFEGILETVKRINPDIDTMICSYDIKRKFVEWKKERKECIESIESSDKLSYILLDKDIVIQPYKYAPANTIWFVNSKDFKFHQLCDWVWLEDENNNILRESNGDYKATLVKYGNVMCYNPGRQIEIIIEE